MGTWSIYIEACAPADKRGSLDAFDSRVEDLVKLLAPEGGVVSADMHRWAVQLTGEGPTVVEAGAQAVETVRAMAVSCHFPDWPIERLEVVEVNRRDAELEVSNFPDLVGTTEVAELLGVSRQRIHELRKAGRFPEPMVELAAGSIWLRAAIVTFDASWERKPGRPRDASIRAGVLEAKAGRIVRHGPGHWDQLVDRLADVED